MLANLSLHKARDHGFYSGHTLNMVKAVKLISRYAFTQADPSNRCFRMPQCINVCFTVTWLTYEYLFHIITLQETPKSEYSPLSADWKIQDYVIYILYVQFHL